MIQAPALKLLKHTNGFQPLITSMFLLSSELILLRRPKADQPRTVSAPKELLAASVLSGLGTSHKTEKRRRQEGKKPTLLLH